MNQIINDSYTQVYYYNTEEEKRRILFLLDIKKDLKDIAATCKELRHCCENLKRSLHEI